METVSIIYITLLSVVLFRLLFKWYQSNLLVPFKTLAAIMLLSLSLEVSTSILFRNMSNNLVFYHFFNPIEFSLYSIFFYHLMPGHWPQKLILAIAPCFLAFALISGIRFQSITENNSSVVLLESILIILYCLLYLRHIHIYEIDRRAEMNPYFWITVGVLFYFIGTLFVEGSLTMLLDISNDTARFYYKAGFGFKYLMCILILIGILSRRQLDSIQADEGR